MLEKIGFVEQFEGLAGAAFGEHAGEFITDSFAADGFDPGRKGAHRRLGCRVYCEVETRGEADGAQETETIFIEAALRGSNGANHAGVEIGEAANVIDYGVAKICILSQPIE
jgi:hypothetical protein